VYQMNFFNELKRRNVFRVAAAYIIVGWLLLQVSDTLVPALYLPGWFHSGVAFLLIIGFPIAVIFAWAFEMTPEGLKKEKDVDPDQSMANVTGKKLNNVISIVLVLALGYLVFDKFVLGPKRDAALLETVLSTVQQDPDDKDVPAKDNVPDRKSIAVLPFQNRSANEENAEFFSDGVHDELLTNLAKISDLKVISRTSVMSYRDTIKNMQQIGAELGVATILEGGVQRAGNKIRINVQLIDVATDEHLWAEVLDRQLTAQNIFEIQTEIARAIASELEATLSPREQALLSSAPTTSLEAYENVLIAKHYLEQGSWQDLRSAQTYLQNAIGIDPAYVQAYTLLASTYFEMHATGATALQEARAPWERAIQMALSLDDSDAGAHAAQAQFLWSSDQEGVIENFEKARQLEPDNAEIMVGYGQYLYKSDHPDQALQLYKMARELDPVSISVLSGLARIHGLRGETNEALEIYARVREINPSSVIGYGPTSGIYMDMGNIARSTELLLKAMELDPDDSDLSNWVARAYIDFDDLPRARGLISWTEKNQTANPMTPAGMALLNIYAGEMKASGAYAQQALDTQQALDGRLQARWGSDVIQVRALLMWALDQHQASSALKTIELTYPELFERNPVLNADNVMQAVDAAHLLLHQNSDGHANTLLRSAIAIFEKPYATTEAWHAPGKAQALALLGEKQAALDELRHQVDKGWRHLWRLNTELNPNFETLQDDPEFQAIIKALGEDMAGQYQQLKVMETSGEIQLPPGVPAS